MHGAWLQSGSQLWVVQHFHCGCDLDWSSEPIGTGDGSGESAVASVQLYTYGYGADGGPMIRKANMPQAFWWYAGGTPRFQQLVLQAFDTFGVATYEQPDAWAQGEMGEIYHFAASLQVIEANMCYHSDHETVDTVPAAGLEASTRAYAKIIDQVNGLDLKDVVPPRAATARR